MSSPIPPSIPVLVTGASSGIGEEFARRFAARGHHVTLVARRGDRLERLAAELQSGSGVEATVVVSDLQTGRGRTEVARLLKDSGPWILVNNAGFGTRGRLGDLDHERERNEVKLNVTAVHE